MSEINQTSSPTPQQLEARERMKQLLGVSDEELDARILKIAEAIKIAQPNATLRNALTTFGHALTTPPRKYYCVYNGNFETVVDSRDAATPELARQEAFTNTKQAWYYRGSPNEEHDARVSDVQEWDHNKFVDWLRR